MNSQLLSIHTIRWLLLAVAILLVPHFFRQPALAAVLVLALLYRWQVNTKSRLKFERLLKFSVIFLSMALVLGLSNGVTVEASIDVFLMAFILKILELKKRRDALVLSYSGFFLIITQLLIAQDLPQILYVAASCWALCAVLISLHQHAQSGAVFAAKQSAILLALSLPLMLVAYVFVPRMSPLWSMLQVNQATTGVGSTMSPGDISDLAQSNELAFRATFFGQVPANKDLYWRAMVLSDFDGRTWHPIKKLTEKALNTKSGDNQKLNYEIMVEPTMQKFLFALAPVAEMDNKSIYLGGQQVRAKSDIDSRQLFSFATDKNVSKRWVAALNNSQRKALLDYPKQLNIKTQKLVQKLTGASQGDQQKVTDVLGYFLEHKFYYTLKPPLLGKNTVDEFIFNSRRGFCEHFASSFVLMMRMAGVPARVVVGYQGGSINPYEGYVVVRQLDAHAWAEVYVGGAWQRVDPTFIIAPERIDQGSQSLQGDPLFLAGASLAVRMMSRSSLLQKLQQRYDQLNYLWQASVLQYDNASQAQLIKRWFGRYASYAIALILVVAVLFVLTMLGVWQYLSKPRVRLSPEQKLYRQYLRCLKTYGVDKQPWQTESDVYQCALVTLPEQNHALLRLINDYYIRLRYDASLDFSEKERLLQQLALAIKTLQQ